MRTHHSSILAATLLAAISFSQPAFGQAPVRIMPVGDSITNGASFDSPDGSGGYRGPLYSLLTTAGYNVDYVGSTTVNSELLTEKEHDGHGGWRIDQIDSNIEGWFGIIKDPDVILLHIGTNDFGQNNDTPNAINRLDDLITRIALARPYAHVIVTNLMERGEPQNTAIQTEFNPHVQARVTAQAALGRRVTFLDMRSAVPLADMPDNLHPDQTGYDKMAAAWLPAIQTVIGTEGDSFAPEIARAVANPDRTHVDITFSKPVADSAATPGFYSLDGGLTVSGAVLDADRRVVTLTTSEQAIGGSYTATVNGVVDRTAGPLALAPDSTVAFNAATPRGYENNVPESDCYTLVYSLDLPNAANYSTASVPYSIDYHLATGSYDRVAYYMELQAPGGDLQFAWASMDAFDADSAHIGVPTLAAGVTFQQSVSNLNVASNVPGVTVGGGQTGNLEFWPTNYQAINEAGVPGASDSVYDFGDRVTPGTFGSMQVHNTSAAQTVISFSRWGGSAGNACVGIGNQPTGNPDWTFADNAADYTVKTIQVLVRTTADTTPPTLASAQAEFSGTDITVRFSEPVRRDTLVAGNFSLDNGVTVLDVTAGDDLHTVVLQTTTLPAASLTLTVSNLRDTSQNANQIAPVSTIAVAAAALPAEIIANIGAAADNYELVYSLDIPVTGNFNAGNPYTVDNSASGGSFSRVAYYLELQAGANVSYIWTSMDAFTTDKRKIGVPTFASGAIFQQPVTNLDVISNKAGITTGSGITTGNIEFWPTNYSAPNALAVPNASGTNYDWGDTRSTGGNYGSMQVHNSAALQTVFALNHWGADGETLCVGIGNDPSPTSNGRDWTFANNAGSEYSRRTLHVMVLPTDLPAEILTNVPEATDYELVYSLNIPATGNLAVPGAGFTDYAFNDSGRTAPFSRVAYYMELQKPADPEPTFVWVSMDAFTDQRTRIGVPTVSSGAFWQRYVSNMNVVSNSPNVTNTTGVAGNLEFWPGNYGRTNDASIPGANESIFDFGDGGASAGYGHGSMQVHNYGAGETLFAINRWGNNGSTTNELAVGIGNDPAGGDSDYTLNYNANDYNLRRLHVLVLPGVAPAETGGPAIAAATGSTTLERLVVTFDREVTDASAVAANFSLDGGLAVTGATLLAGNLDIALTTSDQTGGVLYTLSATGVQARSGGSPIAPGASAQFTAYTPPTALAKVPVTDTGYELIYQLSIPAAKPRWNFNRITYGVDEAKYGEFLFDRVAYLMELDGDWVYASFDPHTNRIAQTGVPSLNVTPTPFQQIVTNMNVDSNVAGIVTGNGIATGNIEFWGGDYQTANGLAIPNASGSTYDFGDTMTAGGHGTMQIHNHGASQTLFSYGNWGANSGGSSDIGIGPRATGHPDWTHAINAGDFATRNLYVLARPGGVVSGDAPEILIHPCDRTVSPGQDVTFAVTMDDSGPFTYQWRFNGSPIGGATDPWLDIASAQIAQTGSYDVVVTGTNLASTTSQTADLSLGGVPTYGDWAAVNITAGAPAGFGDDADLDGLDNGLEWILGGNPMSGNLSNVLPSVEGDAINGLTLTFTREPDSIGQVTLTVEWDSDLDGPFANSVEIGEFSSNEPVSGVTVTIVNDDVTVVIPASNAADGKLFARLKAVEIGGVPTYGDWAAVNITAGTPAGFGDDADLDGLDNGLEWILGGNPMSGDLSNVLPSAEGDAINGLTLTFTREPDSIGQVTLIVEWDSDLADPFANSVEIGEFSSNEPVSGVTVTIVNDDVTVVIPASNAADGKLFARLKAVENL